MRQALLVLDSGTFLHTEVGYHLVVGDDHNKAASIQEARGEGPNQVISLHAWNAQHGQAHELEHPLQDGSCIMELFWRSWPLGLV